MNNYWLRFFTPNPCSLSGSVQTLEAAKAVFEALKVDVIDGGLGEGGSVWVAIQDASPTIVALRRKLGDMNKHINHVEFLAHPSEGKVLARQLPLFH